MADISPALFIAPDATIQEAVRSIDRTGKAIVLSLNPERHLLGMITNGDERRTTPSDAVLQASLGVLLQNKENTRYPLENYITQRGH